MIDAFAAPDGIPDGWQIANVAVGPLDLQTIERSIVAVLSRKDTDSPAVVQQTPYEIRSQMSACPSDQQHI
jgi:hypothetical protein